MASRWTLTFVGEGRAILSTEQPLEREAVEHVREMWARWVTSDNEVMIVGDCRVERVGSVELEIGDDKIIVRR